MAPLDVFDSAAPVTQEMMMGSTWDSNRDAWPARFASRWAAAEGIGSAIRLGFTLKLD